MQAVRIASYKVIKGTFPELAEEAKDGMLGNDQAETATAAAATWAITLQDPTRPRDRAARHAFPDIKAEPELSAAPTIAQELLSWFRAGGAGAQISFELESHGGYARSVTGTVLYLDEEAQTLMVRAGDGDTMRVPLRDVTLARGDALGAHEELRSALGVDGRSTPSG